VRIFLMVEGQDGVGWDDWVALARACETHGLEGLFRSDHYSAFGEEEARGSLDAWATLSALAGITSRIRLGTLVSPATFRHPSVLAKSVVTADHVSGGRVELGLGAGWHTREHEGYGFPFPPMSTRIELLAEQAEIVHRQWTEEVFSFEGRHYRLEACRAEPKPLQRPHPPLIVGGTGGRGTIDAAVRWGDEYNTYYADLEQIGLIRSKLADASERAGREAAPRLTLMTQAVLGGDRSETVERAHRVAALDGDGDGEAWLAAHAETAVTGTVDDARGRLAALAEAGIERVYLQHLDFRDLDAVALVGELVAARS
jgi:F420-dependent oxidoreductase-like protein